jgi:hypothetical protein
VSDPFQTLRWAMWVIGILSKRETSRASSASATSELPDLDEIAVRVTHVAANLHTVVLWLGQEFGPSASPLLVRGPDVRDTNVQKAGNLIRVLRGTKRHVWFIVRWAATDVHNQPAIGNLDDGGFAAANTPLSVAHPLRSRSVSG